MANGLNTERCPTGIPGFDALCNGGFVRGSVNAVLGGPGAGKTTFLLQFLYNGAVNYKENGLYIHFECDPIEIYLDALSYGMDFQKLDAKNMCKLTQISPEIDVKDLKEELTKLVAKYDIQRICFDPISLFKGTEERTVKVRQAIFEFTSLLKRMHVTTVLANETSALDAEETGLAGANDIRSQYIKFLCDSLVDLHSSGFGGVSDRAVRIVKMRRTAHARGPIPMEITNKGVNVIYSPEKRKK